MRREDARLLDSHTGRSSGCEKMMALNGKTTDAPIRILIADDSDIMRDSLRRLLESEDQWQVCEEACNGQEVVEKFNVTLLTSFYWISKCL
jgi:PleD family two-component response regulator